MGLWSWWRPCFYARGSGDGRFEIGLSREAQRKNGRWHGKSGSITPITPLLKTRSRHHVNSRGQPSTCLTPASFYSSSFVNDNHNQMILWSTGRISPMPGCIDFGMILLRKDFHEEALPCALIFVSASHSSRRPGHRQYLEANSSR